MAKIQGRFSKKDEPAPALSRGDIAQLTEMHTPKEPEKMTEEKRKEIANQLDTARLFADTVAKMPKPSEKAPHASKILKLRERGTEMKKEIFDIRELLTSADTADRLQAKTTDVYKRAEKMATDAAELVDIRNDWPKRYVSSMERIENYAKEHKQALSPDAQNAISEKVKEIAQKGKVAVISREQLEEILFDVLTS
jgi:hypothetical protein